ncbi:MAG: CAP domain-containing protein [Methyloceanibacter sp.]|uniref:CAP domain-containing protein n=1 Tax=Methyloceanibacter sp. TaxID=1965321 RepID=UPI003D6D6D7D
MFMRGEGRRSVAPLPLALGLLVAGVMSEVVPVKAQQFVAPGARATIVSETNAYRQARGLAPLDESAGASQVAQAYATYLARTLKQGHGADGRSPAQRLRAGGIKFCKFRGENWHQSWTRPARASVESAMAKAMRFWKRSPGHERALRSASTEIGVGVAGWKHGNQWYYVSIQMFLDTSCFRGPADALPPLPDRNPERSETP